MLKGMKKSGWGGVILVIGGIAAVAYWWRRKEAAKMQSARDSIGPAEAQVIATKLTKENLIQSEYNRLIKKLADNGYKLAGGKAVTA